MSASPIEPSAGMAGVTPRLRNCAYASTIAGCTPAPPSSIAFRRAAIAARATRTLMSGPTLPECAWISPMLKRVDASMTSCDSLPCASTISRSLLRPTPTVSP